MNCHRHTISTQFRLRYDVADKLNAEKRKSLIFKSQQLITISIHWNRIENGATKLLCVL